jgi:hypothetical protein
LFSADQEEGHYFWQVWQTDTHDSYLLGFLHPPTHIHSRHFSAKISNRGFPSEKPSHGTVPGWDAYGISSQPPKNKSNTHLTNTPKYPLHPHIIPQFTGMTCFFVPRGLLPIPVDSFHVEDARIWHHTATATYGWLLDFVLSLCSSTAVEPSGETIYTIVRSLNTPLI